MNAVTNTGTGGLAPSTSSGAVEVDPLNQRASDTDTSFPILSEGTKDFIIAKAEQTENETKGTKSIKFTLKTTKDYQAKDGTMLRAGFPVSTWWGYTPSPDYTIESIRKAGALILQCCGLGDKSVAELRDNPSIVVDKMVSLNVKINPPKGQYDESNSVKWFLPKKG